MDGDGRVTAVLFDLDGTLVDSNGLHVDAWGEAFADVGLRVGRERIEAEIGKAGDLLVPTIAGADFDREQGEAVRRAHDIAFRRAVDARGVRLFDGALGFLSNVRQRKLHSAIATSSSKVNLHLLESKLHLRFDRCVEIVTSDGDATKSKPAPDLVEIACSRLGVLPANAVFVGDSLHDAVAARRAGAHFIGVLTGYATEAALLGAGAVCVAQTIASLHASFARAIEACEKRHHAKA